MADQRNDAVARDGSGLPELQGYERNPRVHPAPGAR